MPEPTGPSVLIVEDEIAQMEMLAYNVEALGYVALRAGTGEEGLLLAVEHEPDLIILDWMLPGQSGIEICRQFRRNSATKSTPIIMLTARGQEEDRIRGLDTGADDYVVKPYSVNELMARVRAMMRRASPAAVGEVLNYGDITLDADQHRVTRGETAIHLGPTEYRLLAVLIEKPGRVYSRERLLNLVWGRDIYVEARTVDVHIGRLRKALKSNGRDDPIRTVRGSGYALDVES
jgi:two-component system phosphate regulon response regulator PhoB